MDIVEHDMKIDVRGLLRHFVGGLYSDPEIFIRELVQNAHDSIVRRQTEYEQALLGEIRVRRNRGLQTITIEDNGCGLTEHEIHNDLSTVGRSGTAALRDMLATRDLGAAERLIGQFGVGLLSAFLVAKEVIIDTLSIAPDSRPLRWSCSGDPRYTLTAGSHPQPGTAITLHLRREYESLFVGDRLKDAIVRYADLLSVPIFIDSDQAPCNAVMAPWDVRHSSDHERVNASMQFVAERFQVRSPATIVLISCDAPRIRGILFADSAREPRGEIDIYVRRMFICRGRGDLFPPGIQFFSGMIECPDLQPNTARDDVRRDEKFMLMCSRLVETAMSHLLTTSQHKPEDMARLLGVYGPELKSLAVAQDEFSRALEPIIRFRTNQALRTFSELCDHARMTPSGRHGLYYVATASEVEAAFRIAEGNSDAPEGSTQVIAAHDGPDLKLLQTFALRRGPSIELVPFNINSISSTASIEDAGRPRWERLRDTVQRQLARYGVMVLLRRMQRDLPAMLSSRNSPVFWQHRHEAGAGSTLPPAVRSARVVLYLNTENPAVCALLERNAEDPLLLHAANMIYAAAWVYSPGAAEFTIPAPEALGFSNVIAELCSQEKELRRIRDTLPPVHSSMRTSHISVFCAFDFKAHGAWFDAVRSVLEHSPYFWEIVRADERYRDSTVTNNIRIHLQRAHAVFANLSGFNPNVVYELGNAHSSGLPILTFLRSGEERLIPTDLTSFVYCPYNDDDDLSVVVRREVEKREDMREMARQEREYYLAPTVVAHSGLALDLATTISHVARTWQRLTCGDYDKELMRQRGVNDEILKFAREQLKSKFRLP